MEAGGNAREIEVRSLTGESIRVWIEPNKTVQDLKLLLKQSFSPSSSSHNFHLFFKGVKLKLQSQIMNYSFGNEEFLVIVPFAKKCNQQRQRVDADARISKNPKPSENLETELAESAWVDLMQDLSSLPDVSDHENPREAELSSVDIENENTPDRNFSRKKHKKVLSNDREKGHLAYILSILQNSGNDTFDEQNLKKFIEFMDSSSCLNCPATGSCVMMEANDLLDCESDNCTNNNYLCLCPLWLKDIMRAFCFLNIYSACLQLKQKKITISALEGPLGQLHKSGFRPTIADLEHLSEVCPQVIRFVNSEVGAAKLSDALIILKCEAEKHDQQEEQLTTGAKRLPRSKIINLMKKREALLKANLSRAMKSLMVYRY